MEKEIEASFGCFLFRYFLVVRMENRTETVSVQGAMGSGLRGACWCVNGESHQKS